MSGRISNKAKKIDTYIGVQSVITGTITTSGSISVNGVLEGDIVSKGEVILGKNGVIKGNVQAHNITASGQITGNLNITNFVKLTSSSIINGDITTKSIIADEGSTFNGQCHMVSTEVKKEIKA